MLGHGDSQRSGTGDNRPVVTRTLSDPTIRVIAAAKYRTKQGAAMTVPNFRLDQQTALVTGAASGIGRGIALGLAAAGANVACFDLPGTPLDEVCDEISIAGQRAIAMPGDVMDAEMLSDAVRNAESELGPLSLAVNSAGIANAAPAEEMSLSQWQRVIDINVTGVFLSCQAEGQVMLAHGRGAIVNIASMSGSVVNRGLLQAHYNASKAAVIHLSRSLAMEWADRGVRVNAISPGYTATPMNVRPEVAEQVKTFEADTPLGRMATVDELVGPAIFLLSDAASFCTGVDLLVDGGFTCW
jgi:NAD(P)-dependent dehydrogenase (short-subunit alcohol dehydrogenase family)